MDNSEFWKGATVNVFRITAEIFQGAYPSDDAAKYLKELGISAILNVSGGTVDSAPSFECLSVSFPDGHSIPNEAIERSILFMEKCINAGKNCSCIARQDKTDRQPSSGSI